MMNEELVLPTDGEPVMITLRSLRNLLLRNWMTHDAMWFAESAVGFEITRCFAFEGVTALGVADVYECGIFDRVRGWFDALGVDYDVTPDDALCSMHHRGSCARRFELRFGGSAS